MNAIITGGARGIGKAIAKRLSEKGVNIIINEIKIDEETTSFVEELKTKVKAVAIEADVSKIEEVKKMMGLAIDTMGKIDILINNAGILKDNIFSRMSEEEWKKVIDVDLNGTFNCCKEIINHMINNNVGKIINIASISGETGNIGQTNYSAAKAGVIGFSKALAREVARNNITVNVISPGLIETRITQNIPPEIKEKMIKMIPLRRIGEADEVAKAVEYLIDTNYVTGQVLRVNGGLYI